jgi:hypothetical protein
MILENNADNIIVQSFTDPNETYVVTIVDGTMVDCMCPDFSRSSTACKHMFLVNSVARLGFPTRDVIEVPAALQIRAAAANDSTAPPSSSNDAARQQRVTPEVEALQECFDR